MRRIRERRPTKRTCRRTCETWPRSEPWRASTIDTASSPTPPGHCRPFAGAFGSNWRVNAIVNVQSGAPFTVNLGTDRANIGSGPAQRPDVSGDPNDGVPQTAAQWFNTSAFSLPAHFAFGNSGRNAVRAPGYAEVDAGVQKDIELGRGTRLELRWEVFNLLNRVNFDVPNRIFGTSNFGRIFSALPARQMQFGVKVLF